MVLLKEHIGCSSSSSTDQYDVFLSFRGPDTRNGFTDHLYHRLTEAGIHTFRDGDELERGESLDPQLENAIKHSSVSIIVFSENYASSRWCLEEVVRILEQKKLRDHKVLPIFYHLDASDVRHQRGSFKEAFDRHTEKGRVSLEKIKAWKEALTEASNVVGFPLTNESETAFIDKILSEVTKSLPKFKPFDLPVHLLGMDYRTDLIDSFFEDRYTDNNVLVIWGIGGIGKTTIAKHIFNEYFRDFDGSSFLAWTNPVWDQNEACGLQSQLLSDILKKKRKETKIYNFDEGVKKIKLTISKKKVLLVLDAVSDKNQLDSLLGRQQEFYPGSKILVTTRNEFFAKHFNAHPKVVKVECFKYNDSLKLFSWHAFRQFHPPKEYKQLSEEILSRCEGLPLALEVLGSSLRQKLDISFWIGQLEKWDKILNPDIHKIMKLSYDSLEDDTARSLFLHVACFFVGEEEDYIVKILDGCDLHATVGIQSLINRCLVTIDDKRLMMHRVIQDMGREIVRQESPNEPGQRSRLWCHEDAFNVLKYDKGTEAVQGLILNEQTINEHVSTGSAVAACDANPLSVSILGYMKKKKEEFFDRYLASKEADLKLDAFGKMVNLQLVKLNYMHLSGSCNKFPEKLRWISWHGFPEEYLPIGLPLQKLVALDLRHSLLKQVWNGYKEVNSLKILNLSHSKHLYKTPDFRGLRQLERLILKGCSELAIVCKTIGILEKLSLLDLHGCKKLRDLPLLPKSIVTIDLTGCDLGGFPREQQNTEPFSWKKILKFSSPSISTGSVKFLTNLPHLLVSLDLTDCNLSDECFPRDLGGLSSLETINLSGNLITRLPNCVGNLSKSGLSLLYITDCPQLRSVTNPPCTVKCMLLQNNTQLEKIKFTYKYRDIILDVDAHTDYIEMEGLFKLAQASTVDRKVIKNLGLESLSIDSVTKVLYEFGIFSTIVEGRNVPSCFRVFRLLTFTEDGGSQSLKLEKEWDEEQSPIRIRYTIPSSTANKILGLNICFCIRLNKLECESVPEEFQFALTVYNKTKDCAWTYKSMGSFLVVDSMIFHRGVSAVLAEVLWVTTWKCEDLLASEDKLEVYLQNYGSTYDFEVMECGIRTVYEEDNLESDNENVEDDDCLRWTDELIASLSNYRTPRTTYYLQSPFFYLYQKDIGKITNWRHTAKHVDWWGFIRTLSSVKSVAFPGFQSYHSKYSSHFTKIPECEILPSFQIGPK